MSGSFFSQSNPIPAAEKQMLDRILFVRDTCPVNLSAHARTFSTRRSIWNQVCFDIETKIVHRFRCLAERMTVDSIQVSVTIFVKEGANDPSEHKVICKPMAGCCNACTMYIHRSGPCVSALFQLIDCTQANTRPLSGNFCLILSCSAGDISIFP